MTLLSFTALVWIHIGQLFAFTVGILLINPTGRAANLWLAANMASCIGMIALALGVANPLALESIVAGISNIAAMTLRAIAQSHGPLLSRQNRTGSLCTFLGVLGIPALVVLRDTDYRSLIMSITGIFLVVGTCFYLNANRKWRGLPGQRQMVALYAIILVLLIAMLARSYPIGPHTRFFGTTNFQTTGAIVMGVVAMFMQIFFSNILLGRKSRVTMLAERRNTRNKERTRILVESRNTIERLANERLNLLRMMTHEVRQPLNNAQAALQAVMHEMNARDLNPQLAKMAAARVQLVLDEVILSLSNSIVAASMIEWKNKPTMVYIGASETLDLAVMDCPSTETGRFCVNRPEDEIFVYADPILLRLALRNLLANALKYSPPESEVDVDVLLDEERYGVAFRISNRVSDPRLLLGDLFARGKRGMDNIYEGFGLGLFMANETARIHNGNLTYWQSSPEEVTFELFIPA